MTYTEVDCVRTCALEIYYTIIVFTRYDLEYWGGLCENVCCWDLLYYYSGHTL